ncbi:hypothetical protein M413DRAFT_447972 [Hebeloma cylindrosporum]|uniref:Uncharacterized protein n=1 Tax=Hebeloma cylindrosporum TaxID=76867 RepID=A0A0C3C3S0_HEBCY|nr:hypothetical protein M413DRAFT_447972 [Hebeloma cylindrosporum h7]
MYVDEKFQSEFEVDEFHNPWKGRRSKARDSGRKGKERKVSKGKMRVKKRAQEER